MLTLRSQLNSIMASIATTKPRQHFLNSGRHELKIANKLVLTVRIFVFKVTEVNIFHGP